MLPVIALVGRPNVGKSTFFNRLTRSRDAIVADFPGLTRDRQYGQGRVGPGPYIVVDTGGFEPVRTEGIVQAMAGQAELAIEEADVVLFLTDARAGLTPQDIRIAQHLRRADRPVVLLVNKAEGLTETAKAEFYELGLGEPHLVSGAHGQGVRDALDLAFSCLPDDFPFDEPEAEEDDDGPRRIKVTLAGRPNAGKSTLINALVGEERVIAFDMPGTTRDAIKIDFEYDGRPYELVDTAGLRKKGRVFEAVEKFSVVKTLQAIEDANVVILVVDAKEGVSEGDAHIAGYVLEAGRAFVVAVNKWDAVEKDDKTMARMTEEIRRDLAYMTYAPILFISAKTGQRVDKLFDMIDYVANQAAFRVTTGMLNTVLADAQTRVQPPTDKGRRLKIYYMTQVGVKPPHFVVFCNDRRLFHFSYQRYLENCIRSTFRLEGTPIILSIREKGDKED